jgi:hypothetical protein
MKNLVVVIYDGINNSVFEGQILKPLTNKLETDPKLTIHLISFENTTIHPQKVTSINDHHPRLHLQLFKKTPFFLGYFSLLLESFYLKKILKRINSYTLQARGPIAGKLAQISMTSGCTELIIQARGLLAEEFLYTAELLPLPWHKRLLKKIRYAQLHRFEKKVYEWQPRATIPFTLESVSAALQKHLATRYRLTTQNLTIAHHDIPPLISTQQRAVWRHTLRKKLGIAVDTLVFVYNGSCKPWQCFTETVEYFKEHINTKSNSHLLILSTDKEECLKIIEKSEISPQFFTVTSVRHDEIYAYLCAADKGILLRKKHIINWISRPTKALEYQAAHLPIIHNSTIAYLDQKNTLY